MRSRRPAATPRPRWRHEHPDGTREPGHRDVGGPRSGAHRAVGQGRASLHRRRVARRDRRAVPPEPVGVAPDSGPGPRLHRRGRREEGHQRPGPRPPHPHLGTEPRAASGPVPGRGLMEPVHTVKEVAATLRIDPQDVGRLIRSGRLRAFRATTGRTAPWRITEEALAEFIATQEAAAHAA
ncbi:DNA-binding protein [Galactobacter valiniphilus]|uniref:DNA-binding protein n=2 Tax=Galactobacter valiniphilus TaxID=2676122 RepID=A0A399JCE3_9MICC|nr:DNA-binding protein [Galactobacter valiniphilus]